MRFTDLFIRRPVLASVTSLLILLLGLRSLQELPVRQFPKIETTTITVTTFYAGASADLMQGFVTTPIQQSIASAEGIDYLTAQSAQNVSTVTVYIRLNYDPSKALTEILSKVAQVRDILPRESEEPVIQMETGRRTALMYLSFYSEAMNPEQITDYLSRAVQPKLETLSGVASAQILGNRTFAVRVWLNPEKMAARGITPADLVNALRSNNYQAAVGRTKGRFVFLNISAHTDLHRAEEFQDIVVYNDGMTLIRLKDVAEVELGAEDYDSSVVFNGKQAVFIGISATPTANPLSVIDQIRQILPAIEKELPPSLRASVVYDGTKYIRDSIREVVQTIGEAAFIVVAVVFLFLGALRSVIIPVITIPLSLIGGFFLMYLLGYSINLLTLLAMVLAIGLVVDDAIVVVENIYRHMEAGMAPLEAAVQGAREITAPIVSMTVTLAAVYAPIGFMGGITGALFKEFAFTLAGTVIISGVLALTLSPMMCSRLLSADLSQSRFVRFVDKAFNALKGRYGRLLRGNLNYRPVTAVFAMLVLASCYFLYTAAKRELAPTEDQSVLFISATAPEDATLEYVTHFSKQFNQIFKGIPETQNDFIVNGLGAPNNVISGLILKPWSKRKRSQMQIQPALQRELNQVAGLKTVVFPLPSLPGTSGGLPVQFVIASTADYRTLYQLSEKLLDAARKSGLFAYVDSDLEFNMPKLEIHVNRNKAGEMGISMEEIGSALSIMTGGNYVNRFSLEGRSYKVIPQVLRRFRLNPDDLKRYYVRTGSGILIPLSSVISFKKSIEPSTLNQFQQLYSATVEAVAVPGISLGRALDFLQKEAEKLFPQGFQIDYAGQSRQFVQEGHALIYTFFFSIIVIFLVLAAQFESFRDPFIVLISVPMSVCGALIPLTLGLATVNIYTQVGLVTLIGLISKHGILMIQFANQLQEREGLGKREAIEKAASIRLRPILMTTGAMVLGVLPLILATGAGAISRFDIGLVIAAGMVVGTFFTLFVVPTMYIFFAKTRKQG